MKEFLQKVQLSLKWADHTVCIWRPCSVWLPDVRRKRFSRLTAATLQ